MQKAVSIALGVLMAAVLVGCEATAKSDRAEPGWQTTTSYDKIMSIENPPPSPIENRPWTSTVAFYEPPVVTHFGSYFDDPIITNGDGNDTYGWTCFDLLAVAYSPARFTVNTLAVPISMIKEPPGVLQTTNLDQKLDNDACEKSGEKKNCEQATTKPCGKK